jgi:hypothetical protein
MAFKRPKKKDKKKIDKDKLFKKLIEDLKKRKLGPFRDKTPEMKPMPYRPGKDKMPKPKPMPYKPGKDKEKMKPVPLAKGGFPDLSGDGKITKKDILMGRGVIKKKRGGPVDSPKKKKKKTKKGGLLAIGIEIIKPKPISAADGGEVNGLKKMGMRKGGLAKAIGVFPLVGAKGIKKTGALAGRLAKRGYGKARR